MFHSKRQPLLLFITALLLFGCDSASEKPPVLPSAVQAEQPYTLLISEDFDHEPQLSFFPRLGLYRPEDNDTKILPFWKTYIQHIEKTSGVVEGFGKDGSRILGLRSINEAPTLGMFAPLEVEPQADYQISFSYRSELPEGARAGLRIYEFDTYLAEGLQFTMSQLEKHLVDLKSEGVITGQHEWETLTLDFKAGDETRMAHLYFFREGTHDRLPVLIDDIIIKKRGVASK